MEHDNPRPSTHSSSAFTALISFAFCNNLTTTYPTSFGANFCPRQIRGPLLNGRKAHRRFTSARRSVRSNRSGTNEFASSPHIDEKRCVEKMLNPTCVPAGMKIEVCSSIPPPAGEPSRTAVLEFRGIGAWRRSDSLMQDFR
jgi:hypothetical protein